MNPAGMFYHPARPPFAVVVPVPVPYAQAAWHPAVPMIVPPPPPLRVPVHAAWAHNLDAVLGAVRYFAAHARCVAVNVQYPGVVHGAGEDHSVLAPEQRYAVVKANVDALKPLQVGLAIFTADGRIAAWEFNLCDFDRGSDAHAAASIAYLESRGLSCDELRRHGIPMARLTAGLLSCGLIGRPHVSWITHTGAYHVAYLMKVLAGGAALPGNMAGFLDAVRGQLGDDVYDVARMAAACHDVPVGLERIATNLDLVPPMSAHPLAGAACVLALQAFLLLRFRNQFQGANAMAGYRSMLQGLQVV